MNCIFCECYQTQVIECREEKGHVKRRRRQCRGCGARFTTREKPIEPAKPIVQRDNTRLLKAMQPTGPKYETTPDDLTRHLTLSYILLGPQTVFDCWEQAKKRVANENTPRPNNRTANSR